MAGKFGQFPILSNKSYLFKLSGGSLADTSKAITNDVFFGTASGTVLDTTATSSWLWTNTVANLSVTRGVAATSSWFWTNTSTATVTLGTAASSSWLWTNTVATPSTGTTLSTSATSSWLWTNTAATPNVLATLNPSATSSWLWTNTSATPNVLATLNPAASSSWLWTNTVATPSIAGNLETTAFSNWLWSNIAIPSVTTGAPVVESTRNGGDDAPHGIYYQNQKPFKRKKSLQRIIDETIKGHYTELTTDSSDAIKEQAQDITGQYTYNDVILWESLKDDINAMRDLISLYKKHLDELDEEEILMLILN